MTRTRADDVFDFIATFVTEHRYPPSVRQIGEGVGMASSSTVHAHLKTLRRQGRIDWVSTQPRTLTLQDVK